MCGLAGVARIDGGVLDPSADELLDRMADLVSHRGPDAREVLLDGPVGMAFTRLSLVDPEGGRQPLVSRDGTVVMIANGEVYNHRQLTERVPPERRLDSGSDCAVLVSLYQEFGLDFLDHVRGMFAIVLWDRRRNRLLLARDRFGVKPLFVHRDRQRLVFGSEIKALFADAATPRRLDWMAALTNPQFSATPSFHEGRPATWFEGIDLVPAACIRTIDLADGSTSEHRYWRLPVTAPSTALPDEEMIRQYGELLAESVAECATADTELGLFLSGGVDSAAVAALAAPQVKDLHTFTVLSAATVRNGDAPSAQHVARFLGLPNHQVVFDGRRVPGRAEWKRLLWLCETPECGPEQFYKHELHRYAKTIRPDLRGMLLGAASDEFNGGYSAEYSDDASWAVFTANLTQMARNGAVRHLPLLRPWVEQFGVSLLADEVLASAGPDRLDDPYRTYLAREYVKIQQYNCWHEDRTAAGSGIEARVPFLDHRLVELSCTVPPAQRARLLWNKRILREAVAPLLPESVAWRRKAPFFYGDGVHHTHRVFVRMLSQDGYGLVEEALGAPGAREHLNADALRSLVREQAETRVDMSVELLLRLVNLGLLSQMVADLPPPIASVPAGPAPVAVDSDIDDETAQEWELRLADPVPVDDGDTLRWGDGVLFLRSPDGTYYIAVDGSIEYELDEDAPWTRFLLHLDGNRRLSEVLGRAGVTRSAIIPLLTECLRHGLLVTSDATRTEPETTPAGAP
jgi:asparagine synthase (glutamine-hydrolysing)